MQQYNSHSIQWYAHSYPWYVNRKLSEKIIKLCGPPPLYVAETPGPIILGQHSCQLLALVTLHCVMNVKQPVPIANIEQLMKSYPTSFNTIGQFKCDYHIVLKPDSQPVVHATRMCPIQMRNEIKQTLYDMENNYIIRKITEHTPFVSSLTYTRKSNGELRSTPISGKLPSPAELLMGRKLQKPSYYPIHLVSLIRNAFVKHSQIDSTQRHPITIDMRTSYPSLHC